MTFVLDADHLQFPSPSEVELASSEVEIASSLALLDLPYRSHSSFEAYQLIALGLPWKVHPLKECFP